MATKLNSEFNYRSQIIGETVWEKIKHLQNFLVGRRRAEVLEKVQYLQTQSKIAKLKYLKENGGLEHEMLELEADIMEVQSFEPDQKECWEINKQEIAILEKLLKECYEIAEPTRLRHEDGTPYTDEEMWEMNAVNEFTVMIGKDIYSEIIAYGRPSPAKLRNAMSNPTTWNTLLKAGLIPPDTPMLIASNDPSNIALGIPDGKELYKLKE